VASRPKVTFWPDGNTNPGNYGWLFVFHRWTFYFISYFFFYLASSLFPFNTLAFLLVFYCFVINPRDIFIDISCFLSFSPFFLLEPPIHIGSLKTSIPVLPSIIYVTFFFTSSCEIQAIRRNLFLLSSVKFWFSPVRCVLVAIVRVVLLWLNKRWTVVQGCEIIMKWWPVLCKWNRWSLRTCCRPSVVSFYAGVLIVLKTLQISDILIPDFQKLR
jgi:hypothetical protein